MRVTLLTLVVALLAFSIESSLSADPECLYRQIRNLPMHWANPADCGRFYRCTNKNVKREVICAAEKEYNPKTGKCASAGKGYCKLTLAAPIVGDDNACTNEVSGAYVPVQGQCREYYICNDKSAFVQNCDAGSIFNSTLAACVPDNDIDCWQNFCLTQADGQYLADETSCLNFYICNKNEAVEQSCSSGSYFNTTDNNCQPDENNENCWENYCLTEPDGKWIKNPANCHAYYVCQNKTATLQTCEEGSYFDWTTDTCQPGECPDDETTTPGEPCEPTPAPKPSPQPGECTCPGGYKEGELLPDPTSCMNYYICSDSVLVRADCGDGNYFNTNTTSCEPDTDGICPQCNSNYRRAKRSLDENEIMMPIHSLNGVEKLETLIDEERKEALLKNDDSLALSVIEPVLSCANRYMEGELIPHESECRKYQVCHNGELSTHECGFGSYFDHENRACLRDENFVCNPRPEPQPQPEPETAVVPYVEQMQQAAETPTCCSTDQSGCTCPGGYAPGSIQPHPTDCDKYYACENGQLVIRECGTDFRFDNKFEICVPDTDHICWPVDDGCGCGGTVPSCNGVEDGHVFPNAQDCTAYYTCQNGVAEPSTCDLGDWYNPEQRVCELDLSANCTNPCAGTTGIVFLPHPDCTKFYFCNDGAAHVESCLSGWGFDALEGVCTASATCEANMCQGKDDGVTFPVAGDKTKFYYCLSNVASIRDCPSNTEYNENTGICLQAPSSNCDQAQCLSADDSKTFPTLDNSLNYFCLCRNGEAYITDCPTDYIYNADLQTCYSNAPCDPEVCYENPEYYVSVNRNFTNSFCLCVDKTQVTVECPNQLEFNPYRSLCLEPVTQDPNCNQTFCLNAPAYTTTSAINGITNGFCLCLNGGSTFHDCPAGATYLPDPGFCYTPTAENECDVTQCASGNTEFLPTYNDPYAFCYCTDENTVELKNCPSGSKFNSAVGACLQDSCDSSLCTSSTPANKPFPAIDYPYGFCTCNGNEAVFHSCEPNTIFDESKEICTEEVNVECDIKLCQVSGVPYPFTTPAIDDEYSFCYCLSNNNVQLFHCPAGKYYDQGKAVCMEVDSGTQPPPGCGEDQCTCPGGYPAGSMLPHPNNCNQYYICSNGQLKLQNCGSNEYFNTASGECMRDTNGVCSDTPSTCTCVGAYHENELIANPNNNRVFYRCLNAQLQEESCNPSYYFDPVQSTCVSQYDNRKFYTPRTATIINHDDKDVRTFKVLNNLFKKLTSAF